MSPAVILDADFLSAFLKIERLDLVKDLFQVDHLLTPPAVYREISQTHLLVRLTALPWIRVEEPDAARLEEILADPSLAGLGAGEQEAMALTAQLGDALLLMNDNRARQKASEGPQSPQHPGVPACLQAPGLVDRSGLAHIVDALEQRDRYKFRKDTLDLLLS